MEKEKINVKTFGEIEPVFIEGLGTMEESDHVLSVGVEFCGADENGWSLWKPYHKEVPQ